MNGRKLRALANTGCTTTLLTPEITEDWNNKWGITVFNGRDEDSKGISLVKLVVSGMKLNINVVVMDRFVEGINLVVGMDAIHLLGGVLINGDRVDLGAAKCAMTVHSSKVCEVGKEKEEMVIEDQDFQAEFDGRAWTVKCYWKEIEREDPVKGSWDVPRTEKGVVSCDACSLAAGVLLEIGRVLAEYATWFRKKGDVSYINIRELDAALKRVNLALKWELRDMHLKTDSALVVSRVKSVVTNKRRMKTKGAVEMLVMWRLGMLGDLIQEFRLKLQWSFVPSEKNIANVLTRVRNWECQNT